ncbi:MAG: polysaccharide deacetylase family protein [Pseudomonadota bacterium]
MPKRHATTIVIALVLTGVGVDSALAQKRIAITYDDAPRADGQLFTGEERATELIKALADVEAGPVAFFVTTRGLTGQSDGHERIDRYAAAGHLIANHTDTHPWAHKTDVTDYLADIDRAESLLAPFDNRRNWFRFPFLDEGRSPEKIAKLAAGLAERNLVNGYVTVDNYDWYVDAKLQDAIAASHTIDYDKLGRLYVRMMLYVAEYYDSIAVQTLGESPVHVLLLHENDLAALYADDLVRGLRKAGWTIVSPDAAYEAPLPTPKTRFTSQGRVFALAADRGRPRHTMWTWAIDEQMIDIELARSGAFVATVAPD